jgi:dicarboxylate/amino acid:cation (Na+ or H+) symporter, DAACS family
MSDAHTSSPGRFSLATKILLGLVVGAAVGIALNLAFAPLGGAAPSDGYRGVVWFADNVANPVGQVFLRMLFMVVVPLIFCSITLGVADIGNLKSLGRIGRRTFGWFIGTTALAVALGLLMVNVFRPGEAIDDAMASKIRAQYESETSQKMDQAKSSGFGISTFINIIPKNVMASAASERDTLGVIFFSIMLGIAATFFPREKTQTFREVLQTLYDLCVKIIGFAMVIAPYGVAGLVFAITAKLGIEVIVALGYYVLVALAGLAIHQFVTLGILVKVFAGIAPREFFARARGVLVTAFSTSSSNATLPTSIKAATQEFGVPQNVAGFVLPLGATMNMNGTALFEGVVVLFLAQVAGVELSLGSQVVVVVLAILTAIGAAGVPGGSLPLLAVVLTQVGVPPEMLGLIIGVDRIVDMARTVPNVTSDLICAIWVGKKEVAPAG